MGLPMHNMAFPRVCSSCAHPAIYLCSRQILCSAKWSAVITSTPQERIGSSSQVRLKCNLPKEKPVAVVFVMKSFCDSLLSFKQSLQHTCHVNTGLSTSMRNFLAQPLSAGVNTSVCRHFSTLTCDSVELKKEQQSDLHNLTSPCSGLPTDLCNCKEPETVLEFIEVHLDQGSLPSEHIAAIVSLFQQQVHIQLSLPHLSKDAQFRRRQIEFSTSVMAVVNKYTSDVRWERFMSFCKSWVKTIPLRDQASILNNLNLLFIPRENELFENLFYSCVLNVHLLSLRDLVQLANVAQEFPNDFHSLGHITNAIHNIMLQEHPVTEVDLIDLCDALSCLKPVVGSETLELLVKLVKKTLLKQNPSGITPGALVRVHQVILSHGQLWLLQDFPATSLHDLTWENVCDHLPMPELIISCCDHDLAHPWPFSQLLARVSQHCLREVSSAESLQQVDPAMLVYCLHNAEPGLLTQMTEEADVVLLVQLIGYHMTPGLKMTSRDRELFQTYHIRLAELVSGLSEDKLKDLLSFNDGQNAQLLLKFLRYISSHGIQPDASLKERLLQASSFDLGRMGYDTPGQLAEMMLQWGVDTLGLNNLLSHGNLSTLTLLTCRLELRSMLWIYEQLDAIIGLPQTSAPVRKQVHRLRSRLQTLFSDRLGHAANLPATLASGSIRPQERGQLSSTKSARRSRSRPGLYGELLHSLDRLVARGDRRRNCLGALVILESTVEHWPTYQEDLFESLFSCVQSECSNSLNPGLHLLKILASAGYLPRDEDQFSTWLSEFVSDLIKASGVDKSIQVQVAHHMSVLCLFHDQLLCSIFSLDFLIALERELKNQPEKHRRQIYQNLGQLSRSLAIECPHLAIACLEPHGDVPCETSRLDFFNMNRMVSSIRRVCQDDHCVTVPAQSPYGHNIDAELILNSSLSPVPRPEAHDSIHAPSGFERLAFLYGSESHFCVDEGYGSRHLTGRTQADIRQLQMLGYSVVMVPHYDLSSMEVHSEESLDNLIREKINSVVGIQVFTQLHIDGY